MPYDCPCCLSTDVPNVRGCLSYAIGDRSSSDLISKNPSIESYYYRQLCLIRTDVDPRFLSGFGKIQIMHIGIICIGWNLDLPICPV